MKTLSVLLTFGLLFAANALAVHLKHAHALPVRSAPDVMVVKAHSHDSQNVRRD